MLTMTGGYYFADLVIFGYANGTDSVIRVWGLQLWQNFLYRFRNAGFRFKKAEGAI